MRVSLPRTDGARVGATNSAPRSAGRGRQRSPDDRENAVQVAVRDFGRLTDRGVSHHDVDQLVESGAGVPRKARCFWTSPTSTRPISSG